MAYIGNIPAEAYISISSQTFTTINGTSYTLSSSVESSEDIALFLNNVRQKPSTYTATGTSLTMSTATTTDDELYCVYLGKALQTVNPGADSVGTSQIADLAVTAAKLASDSVETAKIKDLNVTVGKLPASVDLSTKTITLPASVSGLGTGITNAQLAGSIDVTSKITGVVPTANLGSGTASSSTYLAGDQTYKEVVAIDIAWQAVVTAATLTAVAGRGYPIDTTSNACTVTLPASASVGDQIIFTDYARNWSTYALTINPNSLNYQGNTTPQPVYDTVGESVHIVYMDATKGWVPLYDGAVADETPQTFSLEMLVVAGGGGSGEDQGGGGGGGGYRTSTQTVNPDGTVFTISVGDGGASNTAGSNSSISGSGLTTITSTGGGYGGGPTADHGGSATGGDGGSGGGGSGNGELSNPNPIAGGSGDTPSTAPSQGNDGGTGNGSPGNRTGGGGGGAGAVGAAGNTAGTAGGNGGDGTSNSITGSAVYYAGGGGGAKQNSGSFGTGGQGGGGAAGQTSGTAGGANTGGGAGGVTSGSGGAAGGKGVVILSLPTDSYSGTTSGSPTITTDGSDTIIKFTGDGTYTT